MLGPTYGRIQDVLGSRRSLDPKQVPAMVFEALDNSRSNWLHDVAGMAYCFKARAAYRHRRSQAIALHYDLPAAFYRLFLDRRYAAYTCGIFDDESVDLEEAQRRKFEMLARKLRAKLGHRIFELGSGWGAFLTYAREVGLQAEGMALSREQVEDCRRRGLNVGYGDAAAGIPGPVDRLIVMGMFEHCKNQRDEILAQCFRALVPGGRMVIQEMCSGPHPGDLAAAAFVVEEFFCGDRLGTYNSVQDAARRAGFEFEHMECLGRHYVLTALAWARRLAESFSEAEALVGYRTAMSHLIAQAGFAWSFDVGSLDLVQYALRKPSNDRARGPARVRARS